MPTTKGIVISGQNMLAKELFHSFRDHGINQASLNDFPGDTVWRLQAIRVWQGSKYRNAGFIY